MTDPVKNILGKHIYKYDWKYIESEMKSCDECQRLKRQGILPPVCQEHMDMQFR